MCDINDEKTTVIVEKESFFSVDFMIVVALLLSIALVGYNTLLLPDYKLPVVTYQTIESSEVSNQPVQSGEQLVNNVFTVNINIASSEELQKIPGIGPAMAEKIIEYRSRVGVITTLREMLNISGIGEKKLESFSPYFVLE